MLWTKMMFSLLFTKSITDLVEWLKKNGKHDSEDKKKKKIQTSPAFDFVIQTKKRETITLCSKQMKI